MIDLTELASIPGSEGLYDVIKSLIVTGVENITEDTLVEFGYQKSSYDFMYRIIYGNYTIRYEQQDSDLYRLGGIRYERDKQNE